MSDHLHIAKAIIAVGMTVIAAWFPMSLVLCLWIKEDARLWFSAFMGGVVILVIGFGLAACAAALIGWAS